MAEPGGPGDEEQGRVVAGAAPPSLPGEGAVGEGMPLGLPLADPQPGEVEELVGPGGKRHQGPQGGELERRLNPPADSPAPIDDAAVASNGHGSAEHLVTVEPV